jgi:hypothetical protein
VPSDAREQTTIATTLSDIDAQITALQARLAKARQLKQGHGAGAADRAHPAGLTGWPGRGRPCSSPPAEFQIAGSDLQDDSWLVAS